MEVPSVAENRGMGALYRRSAALGRVDEQIEAKGEAGLVVGVDAELMGQAKHGVAVNEGPERFGEEQGVLFADKLSGHAEHGLGCGGAQVVGGTALVRGGAKHEREAVWAFFGEGDIGAGHPVDAVAGRTAGLVGVAQAGCEVAEVALDEFAEKVVAALDVEVEGWRAHMEAPSELADGESLEAALIEDGGGEGEQFLAVDARRVWHI